MANTDASFGFRPAMGGGSAHYNGGVNLYMATNGTATFIGDAVFITGESNATAIDGNDPGTVPIITNAGTNDTSSISGIVVGVVPSQATSLPHYAGGKVNTLLWVMDDPTVVLEVQADGALTQDDVGMATSLVLTNTGSTVTSRSGAEVSATTATQGVFVIERLVPRADNELASANSKVWVTARKHTRNSSAARIVSGFGLGIA